MLKSIRAILVVLQFGCLLPAFSQAPVFQRTLEVGIKDPTILDVAIAKGDVSITYNREGQVVISAIPTDDDERAAAEEFVKSGLRIEQKENHVSIRVASTAPPPRLLYQIGVPWRTEVVSSVETGNQKVIGITGPASVTSGTGDIDANWVRFGAFRARSNKGKISCTRVMQVDAETQAGRIVLMENGPSKAVVKHGLGRIEIGGARGSVEASTDGGDIHIKAEPNGDWRVTSASGNIHIELPPNSRCHCDASTVSGHISVERDDMHNPPGARHFEHKMEGEYKVQARSRSGNIVIQ